MLVCVGDRRETNGLGGVVVECLCLFLETMKVG